MEDRLAAARRYAADLVREMPPRETASRSRLAEVLFVARSRDRYQHWLAMQGIDVELYRIYLKQLEATPHRRTRLPRHLWDMMKAAFSDRCAYCGADDRPLTQDHILAVSEGGETTLQNIVPACQRCNSRKGARAPLCPVQPLLLAW